MSEVLDIPAHVHEWNGGAAWSVCLGAARTELDFGGRRGRKRSRGAPWHYGVVLLGCAAVILSLAVFRNSSALWESELSALRNMEAELLAQTQQSRAAAGEYADYEAEYTELATYYESVLDGLQSCSRDVWPVLREINSRMPEGTWIKETAVTTQGLSVVFSCPDKKKAAALIGELRKMKLTEVEDVFELADELGEGVRFSVSLRYSQLFFDNAEKPHRFKDIKLPEKLEVER